MYERLTDALLQCGSSMDRAILFPSVIPEAATFALNNAYAFAMAICLDRGTKAEIIWTIPHDIYKHLGHLDPALIHAMTIEEVSALIRGLSRKPRYVNDAPKTIKELTKIVVEECGGDASQIWRGKKAREVKRTFMSVHGVGPGIASMALLLIENAFGIRFNDLDHASMDIKPDVHTVRVLYRLGVSNDATEKAAIDAARLCHPAYPGELDAPLWYIGRQWCDAMKPRCSTCIVTGVCQKIGV
jgi:endonuclease III